MDTVLSVAIIVVVVLLVVWNYVQSKRVDALQKRIAALEKK